MQTALLALASLVTAAGLYRLVLWASDHAPRRMPPVRYYDGTFARTSKTRTSHLDERDGTYN